MIFRKNWVEGVYYVRYLYFFTITVSRESLVFIIGVLVFVAPIIGVSPAWKDYVLIGLGIVLIVVGFSLRRSAYYRKIDRGNGEYGTDSFVESVPASGQPSLLEYQPEEAESDRL